VSEQRGVQHEVAGWFVGGGDQCPQGLDEPGALVGGEAFHDRGDVIMSTGQHLVDEATPVCGEPQDDFPAVVRIDLAVHMTDRSSLSIMRMAVDGFTPSTEARTASLTGLWLSRGGGVAPATSV
jgi:hypothetical protein